MAQLPNGSVLLVMRHRAEARRGKAVVIRWRKGLEMCTPLGWLQPPVYLWFDVADLTLPLLPPPLRLGSNDGGESWGEIGFEPQLKSPVCQASLATTPPSLHSTGASPSHGAAARDAAAAGATAGAAAASVLFYSGPSSTSAREALAVRRSADGGATWGATHLVDPGPSGYSCLVAPMPLAVGCDEVGGGACGGVLYEAAGLVIRFARFPLTF